MGRRKSKPKQKWIPMAASSSCPPPPSPWTKLPDDITAYILQRLGAAEILKSAQRVCKTWWKVSQDPSMWRVIIMNNFKKTPTFRLAVDRSQGQLVDLTLDFRADHELLTYIVQRSSKLRRLTLKHCFRIRTECLVEAVKLLPNLEELHLIMLPSYEAANIDVIGIFCPMLKSFTLNNYGRSHNELTQFPADFELIGKPNDVDALAIAKTMPNLRHLRLFANPMKNEGLEAILDGCPQLESLDIRQCFYLDLQGGLGKRCSKQIKSLKLPSDSISDIDWLPSDEVFSPSYFSDFSLEDYEYNDDCESYDSDYDYDYGYGYDDYTFGDDDFQVCGHYYV